uniref:reverse transcriptase family protein n=1 Tax=Gordonia sp. B7-2 TaxID=3420932 RepID=UPI003D8AA135
MVSASDAGRHASRASRRRCCTFRSSRPALIREALRRWQQPEHRGHPIDLPGPAPIDSLPYELPVLTGVDDVAAWLALTPAEVDWFADRGSWLTTARPALRHYRVSHREKRTGTRIIEAPKPMLRETQRRILRRLVQRIPAHPAARGFVSGGSTAAFAWAHSDRPVVLRADLRHCFESITVSRVRHVFAQAGYPAGVARVLAELCTTTTPPDQLIDVDPAHAGLLRRRHLPQGAPTSPHLANLALLRLDQRLDGYARRNQLRYTRYGDDLAVSGDAMDADRALWTLLRIVEDCGFVVHPEKVRIMPAHQRQRLAGLVVNDRPQVSREDYDRLRALLHNAARHGPESQNHSAHPDFRAHVYGLIAWVGATSETRRRRLLDMADHVHW